MFDRKRIMAVLLAAGMLISVPIQAAAETAEKDMWKDSNLYTHVDDFSGNHSTEMTTDGYVEIASNDKLELYVREESASIRVVDRESGYVWGALKEDQPENLNKSWSSFGNSIVSIVSYDATGNTQLVGAGHESAQCTYEYGSNYVICHADFTELGISLEAKVELLEDQIRFSLDDESIVETGDYMLGRVYFAPFLGSVEGNTVDGYMFVPDGCGALMRFQEPTKYLLGFNKRVFGSDYAIDNLFEIGDLNANRTNDFLKDDEQVTMPVYGICHGGENALFGHVEHGAEYAGIVGEPAGITTDYNYACAYFIYRQLYQQPTSRDGSGIQVVQNTMNVVNPQLTVNFLHGEEANYNGMAHTYRKILMENGSLPEYSGKKAGLQLDFVAADRKEGLLFDSTKKLTSVEDIEEAAAWLKDAGIDNVNFLLLGWQKEGLNGYRKKKIYSSTSMGSIDEIKALGDRLSDIGDSLSLYLSPLSAKEPQVGRKSDLGITMSQSVIEVTRPNEDIYLGDTYYMKTEDALNTLAEQIQVLKDAGFSSFAIDDLGNTLYGEYLNDHFTSRSEVEEKVQQAIADIAAEQEITLNQPGEYLWSATEKYREAPVASGRYLYETDSVPFVQLVLSGNTVMYAPYGNQSFYSQADILRCIEYNVWPSFILTGSESEELQKTASEELFSTCFDDWKERIADYYGQVSEILGQVEGQSMIAHHAVKEGVIAVEYEKGMVYINYTGKSYQAEDITVPAESAVYVEK